VALVDSLALAYFENTLSFEFVVADYADPSSTRHWYRLTRLDGASPDNDWVAGQSAPGFARYANLKPGNYLFEIKGANADGVINPALRTLLITIKPPFWQTWWFIALVLLAAGMAALLGVRMYVRNRLHVKDLKLREQRLQIEKQEALTQERNRIAGDMHDDLGGGLTSIRILSERLTSKSDNPEFQQSVERIADHAQNLVLRMSEIIWAMNSNFDTLENLVAYIRRYAAEYLDENGLACRITVPERLPDAPITGEKRRNLYLAVKESLHNIVKHAGADRVSIVFDVDDDQLLVRVRDNGRGIDAAAANAFGNGLYNMRRRLEDVGGSLTIASDEGVVLTFTMPIPNLP
jgi:signal transduction histidine kinase